MPRGKSPRNFALDLRRFGETSERQAETIVKKIALDLDTAIVLSTPVDTGRARGNWYPSLGTPSTSVDLGISDRSGNTSIGRIAGASRGVKIGAVLWFTNNLPYILRLENGYSAQAPAGMVDMNLNAIAQQFGGVVQR